MSDKSYRLTGPGIDKDGLELELRSGTIGPDVVSIAPLYGQAGVFTFDPGFVATASCESKITFIDGEKGILLYRGYPVDQLAANCGFLEVSYLLLYGDLPNQQQLDDFVYSISRHTMVHESLLRFIDGFHYDAHPMAMVSGVVGSMAAFYHDSMDIDNPRHRNIFAHRIIAKIPTIAAAAYKHSRGQPFIYPRNDLNYCSNLVNMFFAVPCETYKVDPVMAEALDLLFILHADHEQNCSTATVRLAGSSGTNPYAAVAAGISALWGPAHGGANEAVLNMLEEIGSAENIPKYIAKAKDRDDPFRMMGFGHRVYKNFDPRATLIREMAHKVLGNMEGVDTPFFDLALKLEEVALQDEYFVEKKLYPNVDFYSGIIYRALDIPRSMFTVMFAIARTVGWVAHWQEMIADPDAKIGRPRQLYVGSDKRDVAPLGKRS